MFELGQDLTLAAKALVGIGVAAGTGDQLDGDALAIFAVGAVGEIDDAHASASNLVEDRVGADLQGRFFGRIGPESRSGKDGGVELLGFALHGKQRFDGGAEVGIGTAEAVENFGTLGGVGIEDTGENGFYFAPARRGHAGGGVPSIF